MELAYVMKEANWRYGGTWWWGLFTIFDGFNRAFLKRLLNTFVTMILALWKSFVSCSMRDYGQVWPCDQWRLPDLGRRETWISKNTMRFKWESHYGTERRVTGRVLLHMRQISNWIDDYETYTTCSIKFAVKLGPAAFHLPPHVSLPFDIPEHFCTCTSGSIPTYIFIPKLCIILNVKELNYCQYYYV